jgi:PTS system beta-glucosides-specific IIC component
MGFFSKLFGKSEEKLNPNHLYAPMAGVAVPVTEVPDPTFAEGMLGDGIAIIPTDGKVCAPCDATVDMMFTTGHAVSLTTESGAEILIHVGLETVSLEGKPFDVKVASGDKVKKGQVLMIADLEAIKAAGLNTITPMLVCNSADFSAFNKTTGKDVTNADVVIEMGK